MNHMDDEFFKLFLNWQKDFPCPQCSKPKLDFSTNQNTKKPIICTSCHTQFTFKKESGE